MDFTGSNKMNNEEKVIGYPYSIDVRVALLESSIANINQTLQRIEIDIKDIKKESKSDFRWILTIIAAVGGIMAHGFHWF